MSRRVNLKYEILNVFLVSFKMRETKAKPITKDKLDSTSNDKTIKINPKITLILFLETKYLKPKSRK